MLEVSELEHVLIGSSVTSINPSNKLVNSYVGMSSQASVEVNVILIVVMIQEAVT